MPHIMSPAIGVGISLLLVATLLTPFVIEPLGCIQTISTLTTYS